MTDEVDTNDVQTPKETAVKPVRDPVTGQFLKGCPAGPGRPKGSKDKLNVQVIETLEKLWQTRGQELVEQLAAEKPEVVMALIGRLIPQQLAQEAISGEIAADTSKNTDVTIKVVTDRSHDVLPPREVEGELMHDDTTTH